MLLTRLCCTICRIVSVVSLRLAVIGSKTTHAAARLGALVSEVSRLAQLVNKLAAISADSLAGLGDSPVGMSVLAEHSLLNSQFWDGGDVHEQGSTRDRT